MLTLRDEYMDDFNFNRGAYEKVHGMYSQDSEFDFIAMRDKIFYVATAKDHLNIVEIRSHKIPKHKDTPKSFRQEI